MKRTAFLTTFILFLSFSAIYAQPCPPYPPALGCGLADPDCQNGLDGYCNTLSAQTQTTEPLPGCQGSAVLNNDEWIAFFAGSTTITVVITPSNCLGQGGNVGIQAGFYANCDDDGGVNGDGLAYDEIQVQCACTTAPITLTYDNFVIGQTYYIVIDGCGGDICDYEISVTQGSTQSFPPDDPTFIDGPNPICPGAIVEYFTDDIVGIPTYVWNVVGGTIVGDPNANPVQIQWFQSGTISVYGENDCYTTASVSLDVTVETPPPGDDTGEYCAGSSYIYPGNGTPYTAGTYTIDFPGAGVNGCDSSVNLIVTEHPSPTTSLIRTICEGESVEVGGTSYNTTGQWNIVLQTNFGCDSTVMLDLTVLDPYAFVIQPPAIDCYFPEVIVDGSLSFGDAYEWSTFDGCINGSTTLPVMTACSPGNYCLTVTTFGIDQGISIECTEEFCIEVLDNSAPPELFLSGTDLSCGNSEDGTVTVEVTGGAQDPYLYIWNTNPVETTATVTDLESGTYCVTVTSLDNGCSAEQCYVLNSPPEIVIDIIGEDILCNGEETGTATATVSGGTGDYTYLWDDPDNQTTATAVDLSSGNYTVTVTDENNCTEEAMVTIEEPAAMVGTTSTVDLGCNGDGSGIASIEVTGGADTLIYSWDTNPVQDSSVAINLSAGDYNVVVTDGNGCSIEETVTINEPAAIDLSSSTTETSCNNTPDGSATVTPSGGTGPYTYLWDDGNAQTDSTAVDLTSGDYTVIVTDANDCTAELTATVSSPNGMVVTTSYTDALCDQSSDGTATVTTTGGTPGYTYLWDDQNNQTDSTATGLSAGIYNVTITDMNGCEEYETIEISDPDAVSLSSTTEDALCNGDENGSATVTASGGTAGYTYLWDDQNDQTTATASNLPSGTYTVIVTDANGCTESETVVIAEPALLTLATDETAALCNQQADGTATVTPSGGIGPYTYLWNDQNNQTDSTATALLAGDYTVIVEDANGCTEQASVTITEPPLLVLDTEGTDPDCNTSQDGTATVTPSGGTGPYTYLWDDPNGQTTATASGLDGGLVTVIVTDANGCSETQSVNLTAPSALSLTTSQEDVLCFGESTGTATVTPSGGTSPYTYEWNDNATQNTATAVNLEAGTYTVIVTDDNDCTEQITVDLTQPSAPLDAAGTSTDALCGVNNGTIDLTVTGGTGPYSYEWNPGGSTDEDPQDLGPGTYTVVVTDANGCTFSTSVQVSTPSGLEALVSVTDVNCNGETNGMVDITVNGGVSPYTYLWNNNETTEDLIDVGAGNYSLTLTDTDGCTVIANALVEEPDLLEATATPSQASCGGSDGSISLVVSGGTGSGTYSFDWENDGTGETYPDQSPSGLPQGDYTGVVTDGNGCSVTVTASVTVPDGPEISLSAVNLSCFEDNSGSIDMEITGGEAPYTIEWLNDSSYDGEEDPSGIYAGTWEVLITDDNMCTTTGSIELTEPALLEVSATMTAVSCNGDSDGTVTAVATGGTGIYNYDWDITGGGTPNAAPAGVHTVTVTDVNGCTAETAVEVTEPALLEVSATAVDVDCNGASTGSLQSNVTGGTTPYSYLWSVIGSTDPNPTDVSANIYTLIVTDANGCSTFAQATVSEPEALTASSQMAESTCGDPNGSIDLTVNGGVGPYDYIWSNNDTNEDPGDLLPGVYIVTVTDANGCTLEYGDVVTSPSALTISGVGEDVNCYGGSDGSADITVGGGTAPFTYQWDDSANQTVEDAQNLASGTYTVVVTDANDCTISMQVQIAEPPPLEATQLVSTGVSCNGGSDGSILITVTGGTAPYVSYEWDNTTQTVPDPDGLSAGTYTVTVTDNQGCTATETVQITEPAAIELTTTTASAACNGSSDGSIDLTVSGGTAPYNYNWNNGAYTEEDPSNIVAGQYTVIVTDAEGCTQSTTAVVDEPAALQLVMDNISNYGGYNVSCWNTADGSAEVVVSGGTSPYSYSWSNGMTTGAVSELESGQYTVTVTDAEGCTNTTQVDLTAPQAINALAEAVEAGCYGEDDGQVVVSAVSGGASPYMYSIGGAFSSVNQFSNLPAGSYTVTVQDVNGCEWTEQVEVTEPAEFTVNLGDDIEILMGDSAQLHPVLSPSSSVLDTFVWKEREVLDYEPWVKPWETQSYSIIVTNANGCTSEDMILVRVKKDRLVYIPNTFSPNNDGFNDIFTIFTGRGVKRVSNFKVFSRWGELVYELPEVAVGVNAADPENGWDGTLDGEILNPAVFVYVVEVEFIDGRIEIYKGDVTLTK